MERLFGRLSRLLILGATATAATGWADAESALLQVCAGSPIPYGWVITSIDGNAFGCAGNPRYGLQNIEGSTLASVCSISPIPFDWVVTSDDPPSFSCGGHRVLTIQRVSFP